MAKILNFLVGTIGIFYIGGQLTYYGIVQYLKFQGYSQAILQADDHKMIFDWIIFMAFLLIMLSCGALIVNFVNFQLPYLGLRVSLSVISIFMPFMHTTNGIIIIIEIVFLTLFGCYLFLTKKEKIHKKK